MPDQGQVDPAAQGQDPGVPSSPLARLETALVQATGAGDVDGVVRAVLEDLATLPGVCRVALALTEGGGRRLRFTAGPDDGPLPDQLEWCHIDAYDDVPLTDVVRTGHAIHAALDTLEERWPWLVEQERERGGAALAVVPLPGTGSPIGGLLLVLATPPDGLVGAGPDLLAAVARRTAEAVADVRARRSRDLAEELAETEAAAEPGARTASLRLPPEPTAPRRARGFLSEELRTWGVGEEIVGTAQLCLSEVVTNAVNHAHTVADVRVSLLDGVLTVLVRDRGAHGEVLEPTREEDPLAVYGRGLMLVEALTDRWGSERDAGGTTVWFALDLDRRADDLAEEWAEERAQDPEDQD